jgi:hypothetical protein
VVIDDVSQSVVFGDPLDEVCAVVVNIEGKYQTTFVITNHLLNFWVSMVARYMADFFLIMV